VLLHGGTSSVLAIGNPAQIGLRNPWNPAEEIANVLLDNQGLSTSAVFHCGENESNIVHPLRRKPLRNDAACVVIAPTATEAEIFSTALLCMGKTDAEKFVLKNLSPDFRVLWAERSAGLQPAFTELSSKL
jgi:thiamine biosynthesis lipoprotein ApbE